MLHTLSFLLLTLSSPAVAEQPGHDAASTQQPHDAEPDAEPGPDAADDPQQPADARTHGGKGAPRSH